MTALVSVETVLLIILLVLVAGLLRSHAELLRRLGPAAGEDRAGSPAARSSALREPVAGAAPRRPAPALHGVTPSGDAIGLDFEHGTGTLTLLAFLTTGCSTCAEFWDTLAEPRLPAGVETVIVAHGAERERVARVASLAPEGVPVVMSSQAWLDYEVPGAPYFVLAERAILGEGVASSWQALASLVSDAIEEEREAVAAGSVPAAAGLAMTRVGTSSSSTGSRRASRSQRPAPAGAARARRIDDTLAAGGIGPDHPSLYPGDAGSRGQT
jgi:hypothetical protein